MGVEQREASVVAVAVAVTGGSFGEVPADGPHVNQLKGMVWELGYLGNRSTYQIKTASGKLVTVFAQNEP